MQRPFSCSLNTRFMVRATRLVSLLFLEAKQLEEAREALSLKLEDWFLHEQATSCAKVSEILNSWIFLLQQQQQEIEINKTEEAGALPETTAASTLQNNSINKSTEEVSGKKKGFGIKSMLSSLTKGRPKPKREVMIRT